MKVKCQEGLFQLFAEEELYSTTENVSLPFILIRYIWYGPLFCTEKGTVNYKNNNSNNNNNLPTASFMSLVALSTCPGLRYIPSSLNPLCSSSAMHLSMKIKLASENWVAMETGMDTLLLSYHSCHDNQPTMMSWFVFSHFKVNLQNTKHKRKLFME